MRTIAFATALVAGAALAAGACDSLDSPVDYGPVDEPATSLAAAPADEIVPSPLATVTAAGESLELWPFTGRDLSGVPADPMNMVFPGVDARSIRAALVMLDGVREGPLSPFDCTWKEAMGANQTGWSAATGWTGSAIQMECGDYGPIRFHIRLFPAGAWTLGGAHFEVQIQGTNEHQVLSWELAEQLIAYDLARAGVLGAAPSLTDPIGPFPTWRDIHPLVYNGLPAPLKAIAGGPPGSVVDPVPLGSDGRATLLQLAGPIQGERTVARREFVLAFDQTIPKPFCVQSPLDYLEVTGPLRFTQHVVVSGSGAYRSHFTAKGTLDLVPVSPLTGEVTGDAMQARVNEHHRSLLTDHVTLVTSLRMQLILGGKDNLAGGRLFATLRVGPGGSSRSALAVICDA